MMTMHALATLINSCQLSAVIFLYAGPDQIIPLVSFVGAIIGFLLIAWQRVVVFVRRAYQVVLETVQSTIKK